MIPCVTHTPVTEALCCDPAVQRARWEQLARDTATSQHQHDRLMANCPSDAALAKWGANELFRTVCASGQLGFTASEPS